jgi:hypothetical protein
MMTTTTKAKAKTEKPRDLERWLTRAQACDLIGCSQTTLITWERRGKLHPEKRQSFGPGPGFVIVYHPDELARLPRRAHIEVPMDEIEARCFEAFNRGVNLSQIVIEQRVGISRVRELFAQWHETGGSTYVISPKAREILINLIGPFEDVTGLVERVIQYKKAKDIMPSQPTPCEGSCSFVATVPDGSTDEQIEAAINQALDQSERANAAPSEETNDV